jgi:hypothetical protein
MEDLILFCMHYVIQGYIFVQWEWSVTLKGRLLAEGIVFRKIFPAIFW